MRCLRREKGSNEASGVREERDWRGPWRVLERAAPRCNLLVRRARARAAPVPSGLSRPLICGVDVYDNDDDGGRNGLSTPSSCLAVGRQFFFPSSRFVRKNPRPACRGMFVQCHLLPEVVVRPSGCLIGDPFSCRRRLAFSRSFARARSHAHAVAAPSYGSVLCGRLLTHQQSSQPQPCRRVKSRPDGPMKRRHPSGGPIVPASVFCVTRGAVIGHSVGFVV